MENRPDYAGQRGVYDVLIPLNIQIQYIIHAVVYRLKCLVSITVLKGIELLVNLYTLYGVTYHSSNLKTGASPSLCISHSCPHSLVMSSSSANLIKSLDAPRAAESKLSPTRVGRDLYFVLPNQRTCSPFLNLQW